MAHLHTPECDEANRGSTPLVCICPDHIRAPVASEGWVRMLAREEIAKAAQGEKALREQLRRARTLLGRARAVLPGGNGSVHDGDGRLLGNAIEVFLRVHEEP